MVCVLSAKGLARFGAVCFPNDSNRVNASSDGANSGNKTKTMETITLIIERSDPSTGKRYAVERRFDSEMLHRCVKSVGEQMEDAIVEMREQLEKSNDK
jgi:hypothetical protein